MQVQMQVQMQVHASRCVDPNPNPNSSPNPNPSWRTYASLILVAISGEPPDSGGERVRVRAIGWR